MQSLRFQPMNIFILEKSVDFVGKTVAKRTKKRVKWIIKQGDKCHTVLCQISFLSGKKKVEHNGLTIMKIIDSKQFLDCIIHIGNERMMVMVDEKSESAKIERNYRIEINQFASFKNIYSQPLKKVYEKYFNG